MLPRSLPRDAHDLLLVARASLGSLSPFWALPDYLILLPKLPTRCPRYLPAVVGLPKSLWVPLVTQLSLLFDCYVGLFSAIGSLSSWPRLAHHLCQILWRLFLTSALHSSRLLQLSAGILQYAQHIATSVVCLTSGYNFVARYVHHHQSSPQPPRPSSVASPRHQLLSASSGSLLAAFSLYPRPALHAKWSPTQRPNLAVVASFTTLCRPFACGFSMHHSLTTPDTLPTYIRTDPTSFCDLRLSYCHSSIMFVGFFCCPPPRSSWLSQLVRTTHDQTLNQ